MRNDDDGREEKAIYVHANLPDGGTAGGQSGGTRRRRRPNAAWSGGGFRCRGRGEKEDAKLLMLRVFTRVTRTE